MPPIRIARLASILAAALSGAPAHAGFIAANGLTVEQGTEGVISVPWRGLSGAPHFWCAAGDYVIRSLHMAPSTRIWRLSPVPRPAGDAVLFSLTSEGGAGKTGLLAFPDDGSLSAAHAQSLCDDPRLRPEEFD